MGASYRRYLSDGHSVGLVNDYRRFIKGFSAKAAELLKNNKSWEWTKRCQNAFEELKAAVTQEPVLVLPDFEKVLEVHTDASDLSIGGVQEIENSISSLSPVRKSSKEVLVRVMLYYSMVRSHSTHIDKVKYYDRQNKGS